MGRLCVANKFYSLICPSVEEALPNGSKHLVNSRKFALKYVLGPDSLHALLQEIQFLFCLI